VDAERATTDIRWMQAALEQADLAATLGEVPVGCVIVGGDGSLLASGHNLRETAADPTAHAELVALRAAAATRKSWRLEDATLYVTTPPPTPR
jgi:tRNA(adenine34) deaminase